MNRIVLALTVAGASLVSVAPAEAQRGYRDGGYQRHHDGGLNRGHGWRDDRHRGWNDRRHRGWDNRRYSWRERQRYERRWHRDRYRDRQWGYRGDRYRW